MRPRCHGATAPRCPRRRAYSVVPRAEPDWPLRARYRNLPRRPASIRTRSHCGSSSRNARAMRAAVHVAALHAGIPPLTAGRPRDAAGAGRQCGEYGIKPLHVFCLTAEHHAVAAIKSPDPTADSCVDIPDVLSPELGGPANVVLEVGIAAIDDEVAGAHEFRQGHHRSVRDLASGQHHPDGARPRKLAHEIRKTARASRFGESRNRGGVLVENDTGVPVALQAADDVPTHSTETNDTDLHGTTPQNSAARWTVLGRAPPGINLGEIDVDREAGLPSRQGTYGNFSGALSRSCATRPTYRD